MNFAGINWETVLVASVPAIMIFIGVVYNDLRKKRNASVDTENAVAVKREPTWVELETSNRELRKEMKELSDRFDQFERRTNTRIGALSNMLHESARQWPATHPGPYFERADLAALENTDVPYIWRNRVRPAPM